MKCNRYVAVVILAVTLLFGCEPRLDTSDEAKVEDVLDKATPEEQEEFLANMVAYAFLADKDDTDVDAVVDGKTIGEANRALEARITSIKAEKERLRRAQLVENAKAEIRTLEEERSASRTSGEILKQLLIAEPILYDYDSDFRTKRVVDFWAKNDTRAPIARFTIDAEYASPNRSVPYCTDSFGYDVPGGLEPGESKRFILEPGLISDLEDVQLRPDGVLALTPSSIRFADGTEAELTFDEKDERRLAELRRTVTENGAEKDQK